jgi:hypothetical protein
MVLKQPMDELAIYPNVIQGPDRLGQTPNSSLVGRVLLCLTAHIWVRLGQGKRPNHP